jgi:nicotinate-nucleotide adenylyltransferase
MKIGLFFGSFNPVHHGHLIIAAYVLDHSDLDQIWFIVSPQNPLKPATGLLNEYHRLYLVQLAIEGDNHMRAVDIEFRLPRPSYTIDTLTYLKEKYPQAEFSLILGGDSYQNLPKWKNYEQILAHYPIYLYGRMGAEDVPSYGTGTIIPLQAPVIEISATYIRKNIKEGKSIRYLVPEKVREEIERTGYYR